NRDPRFYASVFSPGTVYPTTEPVVSGMSYWNTWKAIPNPSGEGLVYQSMVFEQIDRPVGSGYSGFFQKKGLDKSISIATVYQAETDWIEIRFAEVLMNYGECANEVGNTGEALQVLYDIRKRAGITNSTGNYGITATSQSDVRQAYIDERLIEFAYEGKRRGDLRRWKRYDILNDMKYRGVLYPVIKDNANVATMDWTKDMYDPEVRKLFKIVYIKNVDGDENYQFNLPLDKWFSPISRESLDKNSKLIQNKEWGGTFDPLL
ncbi:MAG: RagB/SusD family nutrient uptake outer membrane protein, partial [Tannerellaceae bacterium]